MKTRTPSRPRSTLTAPSTPKVDSRKALFDHLYSGLFAYVTASLGTEAHVPEVVAEAFAITFREMEGADERTFRLHLFEVAHDLVTSPVLNGSRGRGGLSNDEWQLLALVFDGALRPAEAAGILHLPSPQVEELLLSALRKLQAETKTVVA